MTFQSPVRATQALKMVFGLMLVLASLAPAIAQEDVRPEDALIKLVAKGLPVPAQLRDQLTGKLGERGVQARDSSSSEAQQLARAHQELLESLRQAKAGLNASVGVSRLSGVIGANERLRATVLLMQARFSGDAKQLGNAGVSSEHMSRHKQFADGLLAYYADVERLLESALRSDKDGRLPPSVAADINKAIARLEERAGERSEAAVLRTNAVPYGALSLSPRAPVSAPAIQPSYARTAETQVLAADASATDEAPLSDEIIAQARKLDNDYVRIYEFVRNNVKTEWYAGSVKGATGTLRSLSGNDVDQASLLIALLRSAGLSARYVTGVIELSVEQVAAQAGLADPSQVPTYLTRSGQAYTPVTRGGRVAAVQLAHTWVSAYVPYTNYRGAFVDASGKSWIPLDASFKQLTHKASSGAYSGLGGADKLADRYFSDLSYSTLMPLVRKSVEDQLRAAGKQGSFADQLAQEQLIPLNLSILPNSLPYVVKAVTAESATLAESERVKLRIVLRQGSGVNDPVSLDTNQPLSSASNARLTLSYIPASLEDHRVTLLYGGLDSVPLYLINLRPQLKLGGKVVAIGDQAVSPGKNLRLELYLSGPFGQQQIDQNVLAGAYHAIVSGAEPTRPDAELPDNTEFDGAALLDGIGTRYARSWSSAERELAALTDVAILRPVPAVSIVTNDYRAQYVGGLPVSLTWRGVSLDAALRPVEAVGARARDFIVLSALQGSSLEHAVFEEQFAVRSISADKGFALARQAGIPMLSISSSASHTLAATNHSAAVKASVDSLVRQGFVVDIPASQLTYEDWTGSVWRAMQPGTWQTGYFISGQLAGGQTAQTAWTLDFLGDALRAINNEPANRDPLAAVSLVKLGASDEQQGRVGEKLPSRLSLKVMDRSGRVVKGALVNFSVSAGDAMLLNERGEPVASTSAISNVLGIASVPLQLGKSTAVNPTYVYLSESDEYATRASSIYVDASVAGNIGLVRVSAPFHAVALPGDFSDLVRTDVPLDASALHASVYGGSLRLRAQDKYENPVANVTVNMAIGTQAVCPSTEPGHFKPGALCPKWTDFPILGSCGGPTASLKSSAEGLVSAAVVLGNDAKGLNTVSASVGGSVRKTFVFQSADACGTSNAVSYKAWISVSSFDVDAASKNVTAALAGSRFPRPMHAKVYASVWDYKIVNGLAVFQPFSTVALADGDISFELQGGTVDSVLQTGKGQYDAILRAGASPGFNPLYVSSSGINVPVVRNVNGVATESIESIPVAKTQFEGLYAVRPTIKEFVSEGAPAGQNVGRVYLDADGQSIYPLKVNYTLQPDIYKATWVSLDLFRNGSRFATLDNGDATGLVKEGSFYIPRGIAFDPKQNYDVQLRINGFGDSSVLSERKAIPLRQGIIRSMSPMIQVYRSVDQTNRRVCSQGSSLEYSLIKDAQVSLYYQLLGAGGELLGARQPLFEAKTTAAGDHSYSFDAEQLGTGRFTVTLEAIDAANPGEKETREALLVTDYTVQNALPVGQTLVQGINVRDGTLTLQASPLTLAGRGPALRFGVFYSSAANGRLSSVGANWTNNLDLGLSIDNCGVVRVAAGDSGTVSFNPVGGDKFQADKGYHGTLVANRLDNSFDFFSLDGTKYHYVFQNKRVQWKIDSIVDRNGNSLKFEYDQQAYPNPRLTGVVSKDGRRIDLKYEEKQIERPARAGMQMQAEHLVTEVSGTGGYIATLAYDKLGNLTTYTLNGRTQNFAYNTADSELKHRYRVQTATDPNGGKTQYEYKTVTQRIADQNGAALAMDSASVTKLITPLGESISFTVDESTWQKSSVSRLAGDTSYEFNEYGSATKVTDPVGTTQFQWAEQDILLLEKIDARGVKTSFTYDAFGNVTSETIDGITSTYRYNTSAKQNARNLIVERTDRNGARYGFDYDGNGNLVTERKPESVTVTHTYAGNGDLLQSTDGNGNATRFEYNAYGLPEKTISPIGATMETKRDARGRVIENTDGKGNRSFLAYDNQDQLVEIRKPKGYTKQFNYDANGNKTYERDENNVVTLWTYNKGNLVTSIKRAGVSNTIDYDAAGNKTQESDGRGNLTTYGYDGANRLTLRTEPLGKITTYAYDEVGNLITEKDARGFSTTHSYDALGRRISTLDAGGKLWTYGYDANGNRTSQTDPLGRVTRYDFDSLNRLKAVTQALGRATSYTLDAIGNKTSETDPNGKVSRFEYDKANRLIKRINALGEATVLEYDLADNLVRQTDALGNITRYEFDELNRKVLMQDPEGYRTTYRYDGVGNLVEQTEPNTNTITHTYDEFNRLTASSDKLGSLGAWGYDADGNLIAETDAEGNLSTHSYNALSQRTGSVLAGERTLSAEYDPLGNRTVSIDARGLKTTTTFDAFNRPKTVTLPDDGVASVEYDEVGNKTSETDPLRHTTSYRYDDLNRLTSVTDALGQTVSHSYDLVGNNLSSTDKRGTQTSFTYDALHRLLTATKAGVTLESNTYDKAGRLSSKTDAKGNSTSFDYDRRGLLTQTRAPLSVVSKLKLDAMGDATESTDPEGRVSKSEFDLRRRLIAQTNPAGETTRHEYDLNGRTTATTRPKGNRSTRTYDAAGNLESTRDALQQTTRYGYNKNGQLVSIIDARNNTLVYTYNNMGQRDRITYPGGAAESFNYDKAGRLTTHTDANGLVVTHVYDELNRETLRSYSTSADGLQSIATSYDANNNPLTVTETLASGTRVTSNSYDAFDRLKSTEDPFGAKLSYSYDANGNRLSLTAQDARITQYGYDALNRLTSIGGPSGLLSQSYDRSGLLLTQTWGNGVSTTRSYDLAARPLSILTQRGGAVLNRTDYNYDANGNRTLERVNRTGGAQVTTYAFNDVDQLTRSERSDIQGITLTDWTYDAVGSRSSETVTTTAAAAGSSPLVTTRSYTYNARNQLTGISQSGAQGSLSTTYQYDPQGNQIQKARDGQITAFTYDAHDQLIQISRNGSVLGTYRNNHLGLRIEKEAKDPLNPQGPPVRLRTLWDGHSAVMDRSTDNTGADNVIARYDFAGREPIGLWHKQDGAQALHSDALGSVVLTTDTAGAAQAETLFDAWGNPIVEVGQSANKFGYTGHQMDEESGLIYAQARYYDPETGRFLTLDPAEANPDLPLTYNSYLYAYGNPTVWIDPDGRSATVAGAVVGFFWGFGQMAGGMVNDVVDGSSRSTWEYLGLWGQNIVAGAELGASIDVGLMSGGTAVVASGALGGAGFDALTFGGRGKSGAEFVEGQLVGAGTGAVFGVAGKLAAPLIGKAAQAGGNATKAVAERLGAGELLEAGMLRASNVAANVETKLGNLARTGSTNAEAAGVSTTVSSVAKPGSVVTREMAQGPGAGASVNTAAKSVVAETLPAKLVDRPMYGSAGASSLTRRQYVKANLVESHAINDNLGAGFSQFVQKERALVANSTVKSNKVAGDLGEDAVRARLLNSSSVDLIGEQVRINTPGVGSHRVTDFLVRGKNTGKMRIIEVKTGGATRDSSQLAKDSLIADPASATTFSGRRARAAGFPNGAPTGGIKTYEVNASNLNR